MSTQLIIALSIIAILVLGLTYMTGHLQKALTYIYGDFTRNERNKFLLYGVLFFLIIGNYWLMRSVKDGIFDTFVGAEYILFAKMLSLSIMVPLAIGYSYLVDRFPRHRMFYAMSSIYAGLFIALALFMSNESFGLYAPADDRWALFGWVSYVAIESFGSLMAVLFYSFMADTTTPEGGKKAFYVTATFGQLGAILGSGAVAKYSTGYGVNTLLLTSACVLFLVPVLVRYMLWAIPAEEFRGYVAKGEGKVDKANKKSKPGFTEGLKLIVSQPYLLGIFVVVASFEVVATVFDLQFKVLIKEFAQGDPNVFAAYSGNFGMWVSALALASILLGIGNVGRKVGLKLSLAALPILMVVNTVIMYNSPILSVAFWVMVASKGINYALGQPSKEQLYIPTSKEAKYKSKSWVDMFGSRLSKASGGGIKGIQLLLGGKFLGPSIILGVVCALWFFTALYVGNKHKHALEHNEVVC